MKTIPLSKGHVALVSDEDYDYLNQYKWHANIRSRGIYACRSLSQGKSLSMAKEVILRMNVELKKQISYKDRNTLNCQRDNLIPVDKAKKSGQNKKNTSGYRGVYLGKKHKKYQASITIDGKTKYLGYYKYAKNAAKAYDRAAKQYYGEEAILNFPDSIIVVKPKRDRIKKRVEYKRSEYKGVYWHKAGKKYQVKIWVNGKHQYIGLYTYERSAAKAYDRAAKEYYEEKAILNFP